MLLMLMASPDAMTATAKMETRKTIITWDPLALKMLKFSIDLLFPH